jgi:hypothetical protein
MNIFIPIRAAQRKELLAFIQRLDKLPPISTLEHRIVFVPEIYAGQLAQAACSLLPAYAATTYAEPRNHFSAPRDAWSRCREAASHPNFAGQAWCVWEIVTLPEVPEWAFRLGNCIERYFGNADGSVQVFRFAPEPFCDPTTSGYRASQQYAVIDLATSAYCLPKTVRSDSEAVNDTSGKVVAAIAAQAVEPAPDPVKEAPPAIAPPAKTSWKDLKKSQ